MNIPKTKLLQYHYYEIDGWDLMSWACTLDHTTVTDSEALEALMSLDDFYAVGYHRSVELLIYRMIPKTERHPLGEILILDSFSKLEKGTISSTDFVSTFLDIFYNEIDNITNECSLWIYNVFNGNNGYGFLNMREMENHELVQ